jgi:ribose/xylose/arabinose/galactoside ABC-type transport system permease subunit
VASKVPAATKSADDAVSAVSALPRWIGLRARQAFGAREMGLFVALVVICIGMSIAAPAFSSVDNLLTVGRNASEVGIMALGMTIVLVTGNVDLSVGALYATGGITAGIVMSHTGSPAASIAAALAMGMAVGVVNGSLVGFLDLNSFMVTLGALTIATGILELVTGGTSVTLPQTGSAAAHLGTFLFLARKLHGFFGINMEFVFFLALVLVLGRLLRYTKLGFEMYAVGGNREAARIGGIRVPFIIVAAFVFSGALAAFAGVLAMSFVGSMDPSSGTDLEFNVFAASVIGGASLAGGRGTMFGTLLGSLFLSVAQNGFILLGVSPFAQTVAVGVLIIVAIGIDRWVSGRQRR